MLAGYNLAIRLNPKWQKREAYYSSKTLYTGENSPRVSIKCRSLVCMEILAGARGSYGSRCKSMASKITEIRIYIASDNIADQGRVWLVDQRLGTPQLNNAA